MSRKVLESTTKCAHAPWASYNTPQIELIQYGRRIGKKVYYSSIWPFDLRGTGISLIGRFLFIFFSILNHGRFFFVLPS